MPPNTPKLLNDRTLTYTLSIARTAHHLHDRLWGKLDPTDPDSRKHLASIMSYLLSIEPVNATNARYQSLAIEYQLWVIANG